MKEYALLMFSSLYLGEYGIAINPSAAAAFYCSISWFLGRELVQLMTTPFNDFFKDFKNWLDFAQVIFVFMSLDILVFKGGVQSSEDVSIITCTAGLVWFTLLSVLGKAFYRIRVFIVYLQMVREYMPCVFTYYGNVHYPL